MTNLGRHWSYVEEIDRYVIAEWYNYDEFKHLNYVCWEEIFPRTRHPPVEGRKWIYETGFNSDPLRQEGQETAENLLQANVIMSESWTSFSASSPGNPTTIFFAFTKQEDAVKFLMFNAITSLRKFRSLP